MGQSTSIPGIDIVEIERFGEAIERQGEAFLSRLFTSGERDYCARFADPTPYYAARFAAKEAVAKALGCGIGEKLAWHDIEILHTDDGAPVISLSERARRAFENPRLALSISHSKTLATAICIRNTQ